MIKFDEKTKETIIELGKGHVAVSATLSGHLVLTDLITPHVIGEFVKKGNRNIQYGETVEITDYKTLKQLQKELYSTNDMSIDLDIAVDGYRFKFIKDSNISRDVLLKDLNAILDIFITSQAC
jgi:hypothetical protein